MEFCPRLLIAAAVLMSAATPGLGGVNSWTDIGRGTPGQVVHPGAIAVHPTDASTIYLGVSTRDPDESEVRKTTNGGASWTTVFAPSGNPGIGPIAIDPVTPSTVYVTVGGLVNFGAGIYKSTDAGATWTLVNFGATSAVFTLAIDPVTPSTLYAGGSEALFRSTNGGASWTTIATQDIINAIAIDPVIPSNVYAGVFTGILKSTDSGTSFTFIRVVPPSSTSGVMALVIDPVAPSKIYAGTWGDGFFKSTDAGLTWTAANDGLNPAPFTGGSRYVGALAITPGSPSAIFAAASCSTFKTLNEGRSWSLATSGLLFDECHFFRFGTSPAAPNDIFGALPMMVQFGGGSVYRYTHDASQLTPVCSLAATPAIVGTAGGTATLDAYCSPAATSYTWSSNTGLSSSQSGGTVTPVGRTTYTVQGVSAAGPGNVASATVSAPGPRLTGISTRGHVLNGQSVLIAGFVIPGPTAKTVVINGRGPSLAQAGVTGVLANPTMWLPRGGVGFQDLYNDDWGSAPNANDISTLGFAPPDPRESSMMVTLQPGAWTVVLSGVDGGTGVGIVEVFEVDHPETPLAGISTRGHVLTGNSVMIGGFAITGDAPQTVAVRVRGPALASQGILNPLNDPMLELYSGTTLIGSNDNWLDHPNAPQLQSSGFAPSHQLDSAILTTLNPGLYTAIASGVGGGSGIGIVEVFAVP